MAATASSPGITDTRMGAANPYDRDGAPSPGVAQVVHRRLEPARAPMGGRRHDIRERCGSDAIDWDLRDPKGLRLC